MSFNNKSSIQEVAKGQIETTKKVYLLSPARMFSEYNGEKENVKNYNGRQLLEMLQNADDAASKAKGDKKVLIQLSKNQLVIANTGYPFSEEGLISIFHSHLSPKEAQESQIGKKGLGFRSILSWANKVTIKSHDLCVSFSKGYSKTVLDELLKNKEFEIAFNKLNKAKNKTPISTLVCPDVTSVDPEFFIDFAEYDTTILIDLKKESLEEVEQQIEKDLDGEVLLFLNHLECIEINVNGLIKKYNKVESSEAKVKLITIDNSLPTPTSEKLWNVYSIKDHFADLNKSYQISVAWKDELDEAKDVIYSYFRTKVPFHFKGILHGTFELNSDRNDILSEDVYNKKLIKLIPGLIADIAFKIATNETQLKNYKALSFTIFDNSVLPSIMKDEAFDFENKLKEALYTKEILPTICNEYISLSNEPVYYANEVFPKLLPKEHFKDILIISDDENIKKHLNNLDTKTYLFKTICDVISIKAKEYLIKEYASLIVELMNYVELESEVDKINLNLFFDLEFNPLSFNKSIFLPSNETGDKLPSEVGVQIIHPDLSGELKEMLGANSYETLAEKLAKYEIKTFDFTEIIELLIGHYYSDKSKIEDIKILNQHIFKLYNKEKPQTNIWKGTSIPIINKNKKIEKAKELYLGKEYGCSITEAIYSYNKNKLINAPKEFVIENLESENWKSYLMWIGVAELPRKIAFEGNTEFAEYAMKNYDFKNNFDNYNFRSYSQFQSSFNEFGSIKIQSVDDIDNILGNNSCEVIIAWLSVDKINLLESDTEPDESSLEAHFGRDLYNRKISGKRIRNYLKWKLSNSVWLNTKSGKKQAPCLCTTSVTITEDFSPIMEKPNVDFDAQIFRNNGIRSDKIEYLMNLVGVNKTISSFSTNTLYSILSKLIVIDSGGKKARTLYRELATNYDEKNLDITDNGYKQFLLKGSVFCKKKNQFTYENSSNVFYVDNKRYGESIINQFYTIEIDRRRNQDKIEKIFGVKPLKGLKLTLANNPNLHSLNNKFEQEIESFKPYVYVFRQDLDTSGKEKNLIKDIRFKLVTDLSVNLEREKEKLLFDLSLYEYLYLSKTKTIYIKTPDFIDDEKKLKDDINFCSTIAEAFSALIDVDAQRQQIRELFSKSTSIREDIIRTELDDETLEKLLLAKDKLGIVNDPKIHFWTSFIKCFPAKKIKKENFTDDKLLGELIKLFPELSSVISTVYNQINYEYYNEEASLRLIVELLNKYQLSLVNFNRYAYPSIDITELYDIDFKRTKESEKSNFKQILYSDFLKPDKDKRDFVKILSQYDVLTGNFQKEINYNVKNDLNIQLLEIFNIQLSEMNEFNFEEIYTSGKFSYETKAEEFKISKELANQFLNESSDLESLLYFESEIDILIEELKKWMLKANEGEAVNEKGLSKKRIAIGNPSFFYDDFKDLYDQLENDGTFKAHLSKIKIKKLEKNENNSDPKKKTTSKAPKKPKEPSEDLGFLGEWLAYTHLLGTIKNNKSIKWVSKYAKLAGVNSDGKDGLGYDIEYIPNDAKHLRYVEVKLIGWENAFHITSNEIIQGEKLKKHYEIFLVRNISEPDNISIEIIQGAFDYKGQKSFTDNDLFTVINDTFILKFEKTDE